MANARLKSDPSQTDFIENVRILKRWWKSMHNDVKGITAVGRPLILAIAAMAGILAFLASMTATFLGGFTRVSRTPPDDILYVLYLSSLIVLVPWIVFLLTRKWQRVHRNDGSQKWTRFYKCVTLMIVGGGVAMILKCLLRLECLLRLGLQFDHELPGAGILFLFGAFCCFEYLQDYKMVRRWSSTLSTSRRRLIYLGISATVIAVTVGLVGYLLAIGEIR